VDTEVARQAVVEDSAVEQLEAADSAVVRHEVVVDFTVAAEAVDSTVEAAMVEEAVRTAVAVDMVAEATGKF
jgi:hypothetical protein